MSSCSQEKKEEKNRLKILKFIKLEPTPGTTHIQLRTEPPQHPINVLQPQTVQPATSETQHPTTNHTTTPATTRDR